MVRVSKQRQLCGGDFVQLSGEDASALGFNAHGGQGCISVTANVAPGFVRPLPGGNAVRRLRAALELQDRLLPLHEAIFLEPGLAGAKFGLSLLGRCRDEIRLPLIPVTEPVRLRIRSAMQHAGLVSG